MIYVLGFLAVVALILSVVIVEQQTVVIIERFGKFNRILKPGLNFKIPFIETIPKGGRMSLRIEQLDVEVETKTKDDVFVKTNVSVQFAVKEDQVYDAYYKLSDSHNQIEAYVFDTVRSQVPKMELDEVFEKKETIADAVKAELTSTIEKFGFTIHNTLVTDIDPDEKVRAAMNEINEQKRLRLAANEKGEADRILKVKAAEAESQSKALQGAGIAAQRKAIIDGLKASVEDFQKAVHGVDAQDVLKLVLTTQYFDTLKEMAHNSKSNVIFTQSGPGGLNDITAQLMTALQAAPKAD